MLRFLLACLVMFVSASAAVPAERVLLFPQNLGDAGGARSAAPPALQALRTAAAEKGSVKVIVGLRVPFAAEGRLKASDARAQRAEIVTAATALRARFNTAISRAPSSFRKYDSVPFVALEVTAQELDRLAADPLVISITENRISKAFLAQSLPQVQGEDAHAAGFSGSGQAIAILDTGVDKNHPFLGSRIVSEACYSEGGWCPGGATSSTAAGSGMPCPWSACSHGTHVAGIAAGSGRTAAGVAPGASIIAIQVFSPTWDGPGAYDSDIIAGLERVYALRSTFAIAAVNMSLGGGRYMGECWEGSMIAAISNLRSAGIATVVASGNNGFTDSINFPACIPGAVSVGSVSDADWGRCVFVDGLPTARDKVACYSNSSNILTLLAPGSHITSSIPGNAYSAFHGTSMAAPHVAGAWAVLKQKVPDATVDEILSVLQATGTSIEDYRNGISKKRINVKPALDALTNPVLTYSRNGSGSGTVAFSPAGSVASCSADCTSVYAPGTLVTLTATPAAGSVFAGWSGACSGTGACTVTMSETRAVTATFNTTTASFTLNYAMSGTGSGAVTFTPAGSLANCTADCVNTYTANSAVTLTATAAAGSVFAGWSGACTGTGTCAVTMSEARAVTATFNVTTATFALSYTKAGTGSGTVAFSPAGTLPNCSADCVNTYIANSAVTLTATPAAGSVFAGWSGACTGTGTCAVTMSEARAVTATFNPAPPATFTLSYTRAGTGAGMVRFLSPLTYNECAESCNQAYASGDVVSLTAAPAAGSVFAGWSGACSGTFSCSVTMSEARSVTAIFDTPRFLLNVSKNGSGAHLGRVSSLPSGIACGAACSASFASGTPVTLIAETPIKFLAVSLPVDSGLNTASPQTRIQRAVAARKGAVLGDVALSVGSLDSGRISIEIEGKSHEFLRKRVDARGPGDLSWFGTLADGSGTLVATVKDGQAIITANTGAGRYEIISADAKAGTLVRIDDKVFPPDHPPGFRGGSLVMPRSGGETPRPNEASGSQVIIDALVAYTTAAKNSYVMSMETLAQASVDATNQAYMNSGINITMRLAGTTEVNYRETSYDAAVNDMLNGTNGMAAVRAAREETKADVVGLIVSMYDYCGLASSIGANSENAYMAVTHDCAVSNESFAHEFGHLFGARHDPYVDNNTFPYPHGHGYVSPDRAWRTIMAYRDACYGCPRLRYFSSPLVSYAGNPMGTRETHDNARVHRERATAVAAFRQSDASSYTVSLSAYPEASGTVSGGGSYAANSSVRVTAVPAPGYVFVSWTRGGVPVSTNSSYSFNISSDHLLQANFESEEARFAGWGGACSGTGAVCTVTMSEARTVTASFVSAFALSYTKTGTGSGTVAFSPATSQANCAVDCANTYVSGTTVTLTAQPDAGSVFAGWSGACSGTASCAVTMSQARSVTARFNAASGPALSYIKSGDGPGTVIFRPAGDVESCSDSCAPTFKPGTRVTIEASPGAGAVFAGWSGACRGTRSCTVTMSDAKSVTATFNAMPVHALSYTSAGSGSGTVAFSPAGTEASCDTSCTSSFTEGTSVKLTASPAPGSRFTGWSGACRGTRSCSVSMSAARSVTASFEAVPVYALSYTSAGSGSGTVTFSPAGTEASCATSCTSSFTEGASVKLTATPAPGSRFIGWSGVCRGTRSCTVSMSAAKSVTATFSAPSTASRAAVLQ